MHHSALDNGRRLIRQTRDLDRTWCSAWRSRISVATPGGLSCGAWGKPSAAVPRAHCTARRPIQPALVVPTLRFSDRSRPKAGKARVMGCIRPLDLPIGAGLTPNLRQGSTGSGDSSPPTPSLRSGFDTLRLRARLKKLSSCVSNSCQCVRWHVVMPESLLLSRKLPLSFSPSFPLTMAARLL
jgi:hypothetical protein